ncbi:unnamed protein product [Pleuronectes platessa]|uniref:Uncharacterized protein n=1 Tax=Pleuronectes platessa TaxID=8262 RepID=A0A9N7VHU5_PLEPL|nr:unnamed protein product [Pleuronectes platessa]
MPAAGFSGAGRGTQNRSPALSHLHRLMLMPNRCHAHGVAGSTLRQHHLLCYTRNWGHAHLLLRRDVAGWRRSGSRLAQLTPRQHCLPLHLAQDRLKLPSVGRSLLPVRGTTFFILRTSSHSACWSVSLAV